MNAPNLHVFFLAAGEPLHPSGLPEGITIKVEATHEVWSWGDLGDQMGEVKHFPGYDLKPDDSERHGDHLSHNYEPECSCNAADNFFGEDPGEGEPARVVTHDEDCLHDFDGDPKGWRRLPAQSQGDSREAWWRPGDDWDDDNDMETTWEYVCAAWTNDAPCVGINVLVQIEGSIGAVGRDHLGMCFLKPWDREDSDHEAEIRSIVEEHDMVGNALADVDARLLRQGEWGFSLLRLWLNARNGETDAEQNGPQRDLHDRCSLSPGNVRIGGEDNGHPMNVEVWGFDTRKGERRVGVRVFVKPQDADETHSGGRQIELERDGAEGLAVALLGAFGMGHDETFAFLARWFAPDEGWEAWLAKMERRLHVVRSD